MKLFREDVAIEVLKTLISTDQRTLIEAAKNQNTKTVDAVAQVSFQFADAFLAEFAKGKKK
jgi:hypothetical protein